MTDDNKVSQRLNKILKYEADERFVEEMEEWRRQHPSHDWAMEELTAFRMMFEVLEGEGGFEPRFMDFEIVKALDGRRLLEVLNGVKDLYWKIGKCRELNEVEKRQRELVNEIYAKAKADIASALVEAWPRREAA